MKFYIKVEEMRSAVIAVEEKNGSLEKAIQKVKEAYAEGKICLDSVDYIDDGTDFYDETEKWKKFVDLEFPTDFLAIS